MGNVSMHTQQRKLRYWVNHIVRLCMLGSQRPYKCPQPSKSRRYHYWNPSVREQPRSRYGFRGKGTNFRSLCWDVWLCVSAGFLPRIQTTYWYPCQQRWSSKQGKANNKGWLWANLASQLPLLNLPYDKAAVAASTTSRIRKAKAIESDKYIVRNA